MKKTIDGLLVDVKKLPVAHSRFNTLKYKQEHLIDRDEVIRLIQQLVREKKYYVRDKHGVYLLAKNYQANRTVAPVSEIVEYYGIEEVELDYALTEEEIKDYDIRYFMFAKPIDF